MLLVSSLVTLAASGLDSTGASGSGGAWVVGSSSAPSSPPCDGWELRPLDKILLGAADTKKPVCMTVPMLPNVPSVVVDVESHDGPLCVTVESRHPGASSWTTPVEHCSERSDDMR